MAGTEPNSNKPVVQTPTDEQQKLFENKTVSEYYDPCQEAADRSIRCLVRNNGEREMCMDFFQAYRDCKKSWAKKVQEKKREERRQRGGIFAWW